MPLELSVGDFITLHELASQTLSITKADGGEDAELAQEVEGLYLALQRLELEISKADYLVTNPEGNYALELKAIWKGCRKVLVKVGTEDVLDVERVRSKLCQHTSAVLLCLNLINAGSPGRIARRMNFQGREMSKMRQSLNLIVAQLTSQRDGSVLTSGSEEDTVVWGELERKLVRKGYAITVVRENKKILMDYVKELGDRGMLDDSVVVRDVKDMPMGVSFDFAGLPTPGSWLSNNMQFGSIDSSESATSSTQSYSDLPLRDYDQYFDGYETPELETDQSDFESEAGSEEDDSEGTSFVSEDQVEGKIRRPSEDDTEISQASAVEVTNVTGEAKSIPPPLPPRSNLRPLSMNYMPMSPLDIGFPRYTPAFYQPCASPLLDTGYEPPSRSRLANADTLAQEEERLYQKFQAEDEQENSKAESPSQENQRVKFDGKPKRSATISEQLALLDLEAKEEAVEGRRIAARRRANSALARLLESEEAHNFRLQRLEKILQMSPLDKEISELSNSLEAEKATLEAVGKAAKAERREIRKQKLKWLLEADNLQVANAWHRKSLFERTIGVTDIFTTFAVAEPIYRFVIHPSWVKRRSVSMMGGGEE